MRNRLITGTIALGAVALMAGCTAHARAGGYAEAEAPVVFVDEPILVFVEPGIWVVRDYDYAVYYVDGYYWVYRSSIWYRSRSYARGWATVEVTVVPRLVMSRNHETYVHYHGAANAQTRKAPQAPDDHDRSERADHGNGPPGQDKDKAHGNGPR